MVAPFLGNEEIQREEAQEDGNGCKSRGSKELGTERGETWEVWSHHQEVQLVPLCPAFHIGYGDVNTGPHVYAVSALSGSPPRAF